MEVLHEYASGWINYDWEWTSGIIHETHPKENIEAASATRYEIVDADTYLKIGGTAIDGTLSRMTPKIIPLDPDINSTFQLSFSGPLDSGSYGGAMHQTWDINMPSLWSIFTGDYVILHLDIALQFGHNSWLPDQRKLDDWVWDIDVGEVFKNALPHFLSFRYVDSGLYKIIIKQIGTIWRPGKIRFGFRLNMLWESGSHHITLQSVISNTVLAFTTGGRILNLANFSEERMPLNASLSSDDSLFEFIHDAASEITLTPEDQATSS